MRCSTHGMSKSPEYSSWSNMRARCTNPNHPDFSRYGGRGITVHDDWNRQPNGFHNFFDHVGPKPFPGATIDRIDVNGNYEPGNVRWLSRAQQNRNRRDTIYCEFGGERVSIADLAARFGVPLSRLRERMERGWSVERAVMEPPRITASKSRSPL